MEDLTGKQLGVYRVVASLGEGGMAAVYRAYQPGMDRYVALKVLPRHYASDPTFIGRFHQEAKVIAKLQHPHILPVFDFGEADGYTYIVMPLVQGGTLAGQLQGRPLPIAEIRRLISQVGDALDYAHSHGLVHRDVKPSNVLLDERGNCLLSDFGIAKIVEGTSKFTGTGGLVGTPAYMSPEQGIGEKVDRRGDIYSLGVILYEMATGRAPFNAETPIAIVIKHINDPLPPPRLSNPALPEALERVILRSLAKNPDDRFATAAEMVRALQSAIPVERPATLAPSRATAEATQPGAARPVTPAAPASATRGGAARPATAAARGPIPAWAWLAGGLLILCAAIGLAAVVWSRLFASVTPTPGVPGAEAAVVSSTPASPSPTVEPTATSTPVVTATPSATLLSTDTPSPTSTDTPIPTPTSTPRPTGTPTSTRHPTGTPAPTFTPTPACPGVSGPFADIWSAVRDRLGCASTPAFVTDAAEEPFAGGWMYWRKDDDRIYIVYNTGRWESHADMWSEGDPEFSCPDALTPNESPPTPRRGFGKIWCSVPGVRLALGAAIEGERGLVVDVQHFQRGFILRTDRWTWIVYGDGYWERH